MMMSGFSVYVVVVVLPAAKRQRQLVDRLHEFSDVALLVLVRMFCLS